MDNLQKVGLHLDLLVGNLNLHPCFRAGAPDLPQVEPPTGNPPKRDTKLKPKRPAATSWTTPRRLLQKDAATQEERKHPSASASFRNMGMDCRELKSSGATPYRCWMGWLPTVSGSLGRNATTAASKPASTRTIQMNGSVPQTSRVQPQ